MGLFEKLKSLLGVEDETDQSPSDDRDVGITVERERGENAASSRRAGGEESVDAGDDDPEAGSAAAPDGSVSASDAATTTGSESDTATASGAAPTPDAADAGEDDRRVPSEAVDVIKGIGPTYAGRLSDAGIETVADLAGAEAGEVAARADVPEGRLEDWIERARNRSR